MRPVRACFALLLAAAAATTGGCGGHYIITVPDQIAAAGDATTTVIRLQRNDFFVLAPAVDEAAVRFQVGTCLERGAYTDKLGYAATTVPVPDEPGRYRIKVTHIDRYGDEASEDGRVYVWDPNRPIVAVDMDCLPGLLLGSSKDAAQAMRAVAVGANLAYLTRQSAKHHGEAHAALEKAGYPDGAILSWQRHRWHIVRDGKYKLPRIVVESRLVSQLPEVRKVFPSMTTGVCDSGLAARAFAEAGMKVVIIGSASAAEGVDATRLGSWAELAAGGL